MWRNGLTLVVGGVMLTACGGGTSGSSSSGAMDTTKTASTTTTTSTPAPTPPGAASTTTAAPTSGGTAAPKPITGKTWDVKMVGDDKGYRFEPADLTIKVGDGVKYTNVSGGPHNVNFNTVPPESKAQLDANMPAQSTGGAGPKIGELNSPLLITPNDTYTVSFAGVKAGQYLYNCTPHQALGMKGQITVQ